MTAQDSYEIKDITSVGEVWTGTIIAVGQLTHDRQQEARDRPLLPLTGQIWLATNIPSSAVGLDNASSGSSSAEDYNVNELKKTKTLIFLFCPSFQKWQEYKGSVRFSLGFVCCDLESNHAHIATLYCAVCRKCEWYIYSLKKSCSMWILGSTNILRLCNVLGHAKMRCTRLQ